MSFAFYALFLYRELSQEELPCCVTPELTMMKYSVMLHIVIMKDVIFNFHNEAAFIHGQLFFNFTLSIK